MRANTPGEYTFKAVTVDYHVGDTEYRARIENGLAACISPRGEKKPVLDRCET